MQNKNIMEDVTEDVKNALAPERRTDYKSKTVRKPEIAYRVSYDANKEKQRNTNFYNEYPDETKKTIGDLKTDTMNHVFSFLKNNNKIQEKGGKRTKKNKGGKRTKKNSGKYKRKTIRIKIKK
jgi:hypothetical protein